MSNDSPTIGVGVEHCIVKRRDGVFADASVLGTMFAAAVDSIFTCNSYFVDLNYEILIKAIYNVGPDLPRSSRCVPSSAIRSSSFAGDIAPFDARRRPLYKAVKLGGGKAEYYFEPVYAVDPANPDAGEVPAYLSTDEFIADMWNKGVRFGIDVPAVRAAISSVKSERVTIASRLEPVPGIDAHIVEVSSDLHRSDAPRQLANGKLDLMAFQNRFPQIQKGVRLLKKVPLALGKTGFELSGLPIEPAVPKDVALGAMAGSGTVIEVNSDGEFLISTQAGFLDVDAKTSVLSVGDKIVSRDGVSARTTGNLQLTGDYEEFGEVQEKRVIEGESITIHADVFGNIVSRGGTVLLNRNLVGGSAHNARGDIRIKGVASGSIIQTTQGEVVMNRAESCIISGTKVTIEHAANCEILADEIVIKQAEGCALGARKVTIDSAGPRKQSEMTIFAMQPDNARIDEVIEAMSQRVEDYARTVEQRRAEMESLTGEPEVRKYVLLASKIRKKELILTPEQVPQFQKMAAAVGPALKAIAKVSLDVKAAETEQQAGAALVAKLVQQRSDTAGVTQVQVASIHGDTQVQVMKFNPDGSSIYDMPAKDIKPRLRGNTTAGEILFSGASGKVDWRNS